MKMSVTTERAEIEQSPQDMLGLPVLVAIVLVAIVVRQLFPPGPDLIVMIVCGVVALLDVWLTFYLLRQGHVSFVVTSDDITFTRWLSPRKGGGKGKEFVIHRTPDSKLRFRLQSNGMIGGQIQYLLKLRDEATGTEIPATSFGKRKVRQACESQGWTFA